jgi:hypothetical protein
MELPMPAGNSQDLVVGALYAPFIEQNLDRDRNKPGWGALLPTWDEIGEIDGSTSPS